MNVVDRASAFLKERTFSSLVGLAVVTSIAMVGLVPDATSLVAFVREHPALIVKFVGVLGIGFVALAVWTVIVWPRFRWDKTLQVYIGARDGYSYCPKCIPEKKHAILRLTKNKSAYKCPICNGGWLNPDGPNMSPVAPSSAVRTQIVRPRDW